MAKSDGKIDFRQELLLSLAPLLGLALLLRLIPFFREPLINPDGIAYILQAKALFQHKSSKALEFYAYPTNLAYMIGWIFRLLGDWVLSARLLSLFFSLATIIPLYFLSRLFWPRIITILIVSFYIVSPLFVELSVEVLRGPEFWFFLCLGLYCFCRFLENEPADLKLLSISAISFLFAAWGRIEGILPLILAGGWLIFHHKYRKIKTVFAYFMPILFIIGSFLSLSNINIIHALPHGFSYRIVDSINRFLNLRYALTALKADPPWGTVPYFFSEVKHFLWFLGLGVSANSILKTFGALFFLIALFGLTKNPTRRPTPAGRQPALKFLLLLIFSGAIIIYIQILLNWCDCERFVALIYFPGLIYAGYGCSRILDRIEQRLSGNHPQIYLLLLLLAISLPKTLSVSHLSRSVIFKEAGAALKNHLSEDKDEILCATSDKVLYTHFYAHINDRTSPPASPWSNCRILKADKLSPETIINSRCSYLILTEQDGGRQFFLNLPDKPNTAQNRLSKAEIIWEKRSKKYGMVSIFSLKPAD